MKRKEIVAKSMKNIDNAYKTYKTRWASFDHAALIRNAENIAVIKQIYRALKATARDAHYEKAHEYLVNIKDPLKHVKNNLSSYGYEIMQMEELEDSIWPDDDYYDADNWRSLGRPSKHNRYYEYEMDGAYV